MAPRNSDGSIRLGVLALPLAGLLALVGLYSSFQLGTGGILSTGDNQAIRQRRLLREPASGQRVSANTFDLWCHGSVGLPS